MADGEYPEWLWSMLDPKPTLSELERTLKPMLAEEIDGIGDLRSLRDASEEDVSCQEKSRALCPLHSCSPKVLERLPAVLMN